MKVISYKKIVRQDFYITENEPMLLLEPLPRNKNIKIRIKINKIQK